VVLGGLPGTGKSTIAVPLAKALGAAYLRIDTIEQALRDSGEMRELGGAGYYVAMAVARDQLRLGLTTIAECVNPEAFTRDLWRDVAFGANSALLEVELVCSDDAEHERRVTTRIVDVPNLVIPTWQEVLERGYEPWKRERLVVDTAVVGVEESVATIVAAVVEVNQPGERITTRRRGANHLG
jgi:predicted kinase